MYRITANFYKEFFIYKDDVLILTAKRKYIWFAGLNVKVYNTDEKLILNYRYFSFFFTIVKIKHQNLPEKIKLVGSIWRRLCIKVNNQKICSKLNLLPLKKIGEIEIESIEIAIIKRKKWKSKLEFEIEFSQPNDLEIYCVLLFLMDISAIESF